jgi:hypothetical protein
MYSRRSVNSAAPLSSEKVLSRMPPEVGYSEARGAGEFALVRVEGFHRSNDFLPSQQFFAREKCRGTFLLCISCKDHPLS